MWRKKKKKNILEKRENVFVWLPLPDFWILFKLLIGRIARRLNQWVWAWCVSYGPVFWPIYSILVIYNRCYFVLTVLSVWIPPVFSSGPHTCTADNWTLMCGMYWILSLTWPSSRRLVGWATACKCRKRFKPRPSQTFPTYASMVQQTAIAAGTFCLSPWSVRTSMPHSPPLGLCFFAN